VRWAQNPEVLYTLSHHYYQARQFMKQHPKARVYLNTYLLTEGRPAANMMFPHDQERLGFQE